MNCALGESYLIMLRMSRKSQLSKSTIKTIILGYSLHRCVLCRLEQEYDEICTKKDTVIERESSAYQALNLDEMNYESMYVKFLVWPQGNRS